MADASEEGDKPETEAPDAKTVAAEAAAATAATAATAALANPATRKLITDLALRGGAYLARRLLDRRLSAMNYTQRQSSQILAGRGFGKAVASAAAARFGLRSAPKALLVGAAVLAKILYDDRRGKKARKDAPKD